MQNSQRNEISWITPTLGVCGVDALYEDGYYTDMGKLYEFLDAQNIYIVNTAGEINGKEDIKIPVEPSMGSERTLKRVDMIADIINDKLSNDTLSSFGRSSTDYKVIVHCAMGMERSVLSTAWYLQKYMGFTLDSAYQKISLARPIAQDRASWIGKKLTTTLSADFNWDSVLDWDAETGNQKKDYVPLPPIKDKDWTALPVRYEERNV